MQPQPKLKINFVNTKICRVEISFPCLETLPICSQFFSSIPVLQLISQLAVLFSWAFPTQYTYKSCNRTPEVPPPFFQCQGLRFMDTESTKFLFKTITFSPIFFFFNGCPLRLWIEPSRVLLQRKSSSKSHCPYFWSLTLPTRSLRGVPLSKAVQLLFQVKENSSGRVWL